jgi:acetate kinase
MLTPAKCAASQLELIKQIPVAIAARHVHLSQETIDRLFGAGHQLRVQASLSQPGQYAAQETITLVGPRTSITAMNRIISQVKRLRPASKLV